MEMRTTCDYKVGVMGDAITVQPVLNGVPLAVHAFPSGEAAEAFIEYDHQMVQAAHAQTIRFMQECAAANR